MWMTDRDGKIINVPESGFDHSLDGVRYALTNLLKNKVDDFDYDSFEENELQHTKNVYNNLGIGEY
jgi:hypothetical protein